MSNRVRKLVALLFAQIAAAAETPLAFPGAIGDVAATTGAVAARNDLFETQGRRPILHQRGAAFSFEARAPD
jgi:hypothetical protein